MREIKFRAWDELGKRMLKVVGLNFVINRVLYKKGKDVSEHNSLSDLKLMQYTGLKDKNGKPIYEGDIVKGKMNLSKDTFLEEVKWDESLTGFSPFNSYDSDCQDFYEYIGCEVIGNIYEHPSLLSK